MATGGPRYLPHDPVERYALLAGLALSLAFFVVLAIVWAADEAAGRAMLVQAVSHFFIGRETSVSVGLAGGLSPLLTAFGAVAHDAAVLLIGYPMACALGRGALKIPFIHRFIEKPGDKLDAFAQRTEAAGITILALSLWIPFFPGGALIASLIGRAAGYRPAILVPVLAASAIISVAAWTLFAAYVFESVESPTLKWGLVGVAAAIGAIVAVAIAIRKRRAAKAQ
ncbi:MAG TPA: hypothetical protein VM889_12165 [Candidatus Thermoplasmatota archaeon]|nr:hypothetical protein [Candidatus Thermoplasmatota archaeon]